MDQNLLHEPVLWVVIALNLAFMFVIIIASLPKRMQDGLAFFWGLLTARKRGWAITLSTQSTSTCSILYNGKRIRGIDRATLEIVAGQEPVLHLRVHPNYVKARMLDGRLDVNLLDWLYPSDAENVPASAAEEGQGDAGDSPQDG